MRDYGPSLANQLHYKVPRQKPDGGIELLGDLVRALLGSPKGPPERMGRGRSAQGLPLIGGEHTDIESVVKHLGSAFGIVEIDNVVTD